METLLDYSVQVKIKASPVCCQKCGNGMDRIGRKTIDILISRATIKLIEVKRFMCFHCLSTRGKYSFRLF